MPVPGFGPKNAKVVVVGEAPGAEEVIRGQPFVGETGKLLRLFLLKVGIDPQDVYFTNLCKERPPGNDLKLWFRDGQPEHPALLMGLMELADELREVNPNVIMAAGNYPMKMLTGKGRWSDKLKTFTGIQDYRGSIYECILPGAEGLKVVPTFHPSYIYREGYPDHGTWQVDLRRIKEQSAFPEIKPLNKRIIIDPRGSDRVEAHLHLLSDMSKTLSFDIEYINNRLLCVGMTTSRDEAYCFVTDDAGDVSFCREILLSGIPLCAQNAMFDCSMLEHWYNIPCLPYLKHDTMLAAHAANIELPKGLDYLTSIYTEQPYYKDMIDWDQIKKGIQPIEDVWQYNAIDTWVTHQIMEEQLADDLLDRSIRKVFDFEMMLLEPLWALSRRGIRIDIPAMKELQLNLELEIEEIGGQVNALSGGSLNVKSGPQVAAFLFDRLGIPEGGRTPTGLRKVDDKTLAGCAARCSNDLQRIAIEQVRDLRERRDLISKFCEIQLESDGRMRGHYNPAGTDTGRLASRQFYPTGRGANQQNIPRDKRVRRVFIPDPGKRFGYADLERAESLVVAHMSGDPQMMENHKPGVDGHLRVGAFLFGIPEDQINEEQRYLAKRTGHAGNYMMGPEKFMKIVNAESSKTGITLTFSESKRLLNGYKEYYHRLPQWWSSIERELWQTRTLTTLLGRKRQFFGHVGAILPNAVAFKPQGTVGDTLNVALLNIEGIVCDYASRMCDVEKIKDLSSDLKNYGYESLMQIHDAVNFQYNEEYEKQVVVAIKQLMDVPLLSPAFGELFSIPVEIKTGPNWGDVKLVEAA